MKRVIPITEQFQYFLQEVNENFWGELYRRTALAWKRLFEELSWKERDRYLGVKDYARAGEREYGNGFYEGKFVTLMGTLVLRVARRREKSFLPEVMMLIREALLRGLSTQVGRVVGIVTKR